MATISLYNTGVHVSAGDYGDVLLVQGTRVFVDWGHGIKGWHNQDVLAQAVPA
jgi:hypothetical protein